MVVQPHFSSLQVLSKELKANASSVLLTLAGAMYCQLGLLQHVRFGRRFINCSICA